MYFKEKKQTIINFFYDFYDATMSRSNIKKIVTRISHAVFMT